jgi:hypothetical protein
MQQQEQHEEWIRRHTWGATTMDQDKQINPPEEGNQPPEETRMPLGDEGAYVHEGAPPPITRIVEGVLVESTLLVPTTQPGLPPHMGSNQSPMRSLRRRVGQGFLTVLAALLTVLLLTPIQPGVMRLFVSLVPAAGATATITLITDQVDLHRMYTLLAAPVGVVLPATSHQSAHPEAQIEARLLAAHTLTQQVTVPTTGEGHQPALHAHGLVTFYNQAPAAQTIPAGMLLSGADGVQVVTDQTAVVPAAQLPTQGQVSVAAHAVQAGPQGNIVGNDLDGLCCFVGVAVQNTQAFAGGANTRDFPAVGARDVSRSAAPLKTSLTSQGQEAVQAQVQTNEQLVHPVQYPSQVTAHPAVGEEATQVTVQVNVTCTAETYNANEVRSQVNALLGQEATAKLGSAYALQGQVTSTVSAVTMVDDRRGIVKLHVQAESVWAYQLNTAQLHALVTPLAGKPLQKTRAILLRRRGIHQVTISSTDWWDDASHQSLPPDPNRIQIVVISWAGV